MTNMIKNIPRDIVADIAIQKLTVYLGYRSIIDI